MKTNINTENYEAYLLDYMEGNLSPEVAAELRAFIAAQGLDWDELTAPLPYLETPQIIYEGKEKLKQRFRDPEPVEGSKGRFSDNTKVIPLYVKIASAAAAAGLLLTVTLWPKQQLPKVEPIAHLQSIEVSRIDTHEPWTLLPRRAIENINPLPRINRHHDDTPPKDPNNGRIAAEREFVPLLAELPAKTITVLETDLPWTDIDEPDFEFMAWRMNAHLEYAPYEANDYSDDADDERELSWIGKTIFKLTNGRHDSFASLISSGITVAKKEISVAATDMALTAYHRADEHLEEAKERWEEKREE